MQCTLKSHRGKEFITITFTTTEGTQFSASMTKTEAIKIFREITRTDLEIDEMIRIKENKILERMGIQE